MSSSVLYLVPDLIGLPGGIARYCRHVSRALSDSGDRVTVVALRDALDADPRSEGIEVADYVACDQSKFLFVARAVAKAIEMRPDLILCGHPNLAPLALAIARLLRVPYAVFLYGTDSWESLPGARGLALREADRCISISAYTSRLAAKSNGLDQGRIELLHNCLDPEFEFVSANDGKRRRESLLTVSRITTFEPHKGQELVLRAMPALLKRFPSLVYEIVGDGDRRPALEQLASELGISDAVRFHGVVSDEKLREFYSTGSVFVMPSTVEGFGFVFIEAMAYGMPAIGGTRDAAPEVIVDGKTGFVVDPASVNDLVASISAILSDDNSRDAMSEAAVVHVRNNFGYPRFRDRLRHIVDSLTCEHK